MAKALDEIRALFGLAPSCKNTFFSADAAASPLFLEARHHSAARSAAGDLR
jgi:hypothetical protein